MGFERDVLPDLAQERALCIDPFCPILSEWLATSASAEMPVGHHLHRGGTYLCMEGPAFSTRAESELYRSWGCDVIGDATGQIDTMSVPQSLNTAAF